MMDIKYLILSLPEPSLEHLLFFPKSFTMSSNNSLSRPVYLTKFRRGPQRAHFAIFIPNAAYVQNDPNDRSKSCLGTLIHVVGALMAGYGHEFKRNYNCRDSQSLEKLVYLGTVNANHFTEPQTRAMAKDATATGLLERVAL